MSDYRFGVDDYGLNYYPHDGVYDEQEGIDWSKVERVEIDWVDFVRERTCHIVKNSRKYVLSDGRELFDDGCSICNGYVGDGDNYCSNCGARVKDVDNDN